MTRIEFRAPWSGQLRVATAVALAVLATALAAVILTRSQMPLFLFPLLIGLPPLFVATTAAFMVRGYVLTDEGIFVRRLGWTTRLPLAELRSVTGDAEAMRGSLRLFGNGGLFAFSGVFWNRKLGRYRALATDPSRSVVLRYPKRTIVITPHDPQQFIVRARTLLKYQEYR